MVQISRASKMSHVVHQALNSYTLYLSRRNPSPIGALWFRYKIIYGGQVRIANEIFTAQRLPHTTDSFQALHPFLAGRPRCSCNCSVSLHQSLCGCKSCVNLWWPRIRRASVDSGGILRYFWTRSQGQNFVKNHTPDPK